MIFLELLAIAVGVVIAFTLMIVGLVEAPWPVLLVLLIVGWYSLQRLSNQTKIAADLTPEPTAEEPVEEDDTKTAHRPATAIKQFVLEQIAVRSHKPNQFISNLWGDSSVEPVADPSDKPSVQSAAQLSVKSPVQPAIEQAASNPATVDHDTEAELKYRGVCYHHDAPEADSTDLGASQGKHKAAKPPVKGKYRGQDWERLHASQTSSQPQIEVQYRGHKVPSNGSSNGSSGA